MRISKDSVEKQEKFRDKHDLTVPLLSDDQDVCERFGGRFSEVVGALRRELARAEPLDPAVEARLRSRLQEV